MDQGTILSMIAGAGVTMGGAIWILFNTVMKQNGKHHNEILNLSSEIGDLKEKIGEGKGIRDLSREVLQTVHNATVNIPPNVNIQNNPIPPKE